MLLSSNIQPNPQIQHRKSEGLHSHSTQLLLGDDRPINVLDTESGGSCSILDSILAATAVVPRLLLNGSLVHGRPSFLVAFEVGCHDSDELNGECGEHENQAEHQRESEFVGCILQRSARDVVDPDLETGISIRSRALA